MPIRPEHVFLYPIDWAQLSRHVRFVRARGACEHCGRPHGQKVFHLGDGRWWDRVRRYWRDGQGRRVRRLTENILARGAWTPVVLACAHLNHDPSDSSLHQLAAPALPHDPRWPGASPPALDECALSSGPRRPVLRPLPDARSRLDYAHTDQHARKRQRTRWQQSIEVSRRATPLARPPRLMIVAPRVKNGQDLADPSG
jgi:hypothetical protein